MARPDVALMISSLMTKQSRAVLESCTKMQYHQNRTHAHQGHPKNTHAPHMPPSSTLEPSTHAPRKSTHAHTCPARGMCGHVYKFEHCARPLARAAAPSSQTTSSISYHTSSHSFTHTLHPTVDSSSPSNPYPTNKARTAITGIPGL